MNACLGTFAALCACCGTCVVAQARVAFPPPPPELPAGSGIVFGNAAATPPPAPIPPSDILTAGWADGTRPHPPPPRPAPPPPVPSPFSPPPSPSLTGTQPSAGRQHTGLSPGTIGGIIGGVLGGVVAVTILLALTFLVRRRRAFHRLDSHSTAGSRLQPQGSHKEAQEQMLEAQVRSDERVANCSAEQAQKDGLGKLGTDDGRIISWLSDRSVPRPLNQPARLTELVVFQDELTDVASEPVPHSPRHDSDSYIQPTPGLSAAQQTLPASIPSTPAAPSKPSTGSRSHSGHTASTQGTLASGQSILPDLPWSDWELKPEDLQICSRPDGSRWHLGSGAYGSVYKGLLDGVQEVAVKVFHESASNVAVDNVLREVAILKGCRNRNIVQFLGACIQSDQIQLVTEFMEAGDLWHALIAFRASGALSWYKRGRRVALQVTQGLHFLHSRRIVHFDMKSGNILLTRDGTAKISDVGFANILSNTHLTNQAAFTFAWAAPEVLLGQPCTFTADIYSLGVVLWELATGEQPRRGQLRPCRVPEECPTELEQLIAACMHTEPHLRPSTKTIVDQLQALQEPTPQ